MRRVARGEKDALGELYDLYGRLVYSVALHFVHDTNVAEEITQDVFVTIWTKARDYNPEKAGVSTWMLRITRNRSIDELRRHKSRRDIPVGSTMEVVQNTNSANSEEEDPENLALREWDRVRIVQAVDSLPEQQREALRLAYFQDLTHREIAEELNEPLGTVKSRIRMGLQKLRKMLEAGEVTE
ncbi:sigma-70 family RNA polymerase sigma factor [Salinispira pacifica]